MGEKRDPVENGFRSGVVAGVLACGEEEAAQVGLPFLAEAASTATVAARERKPQLHGVASSMELRAMPVQVVRVAGSAASGDEDLLRQTLGFWVGTVGGHDSAAPDSNRNEGWGGGGCAFGGPSTGVALVRSWISGMQGLSVEPPARRGRETR